ncbi:MAG: tRNA (N6-threonylcarbamoyladenosine(37)-N6)-methyltransferase TrmO [Lachnospiraceae bacterium]
MEPIAHIQTDFPTKFGLPRQSGLIEELKGIITFEPEYRKMEAFRGLENFSHIWLLWKFSESKKENWAATVRPPRLGGKQRMGVFATRSPFRPNDIGLSCVKLEEIRQDPVLGPQLLVAGIDLMDQTPIYDVKPYVPLTDCHPDATEGFTKQTKQHTLSVFCSDELLSLLPKEKQAGALAFLKQDPRPAYDTDEERIYGVAYAGFDIHFQVHGEHLYVCDIKPLE